MGVSLFDEQMIFFFLFLSKYDSKLNLKNQDFQWLKFSIIKKTCISIILFDHMSEYCSLAITLEKF